MVGFEVTPTTASSLIIRASFPVSSMSRETKSLQTLWPSADSLCRFESGTGHRPFHVFDLLESLQVTIATVEMWPEEGGDQIFGKRRPHDLGAEAEDVHVVVLDALMGRVDVVANGGADPGELAGGDRGAHTRSADEHTTLGVPAEDRLAEFARLVRIVDPDGVGIGSQVHQLMPGKRLEDGVTKTDAAVVECNRHLHDGTVPDGGELRPTP